MPAPDPYSVFRFVVEINYRQIGGFSEVSGLQAETETEEIREGGVNDHVHKLAKLTKYPNLVLKRGLTDAGELWQWHQEVVSGKFKRKTIAVVLQERQQEKWRWVFNDAYPVKWSGADLNATSNTTAVERVELVHHGITRGEPGPKQ